LVSRRIEHIVILGALSAFAPLAIDMYLPALPALQLGFGATPAQVQMTLATFFFGFAVGQAFYGPIADRHGRKLPLYVGLTLFTLASAACAFAPSIGAMIGLRLVQALGACAGVVIARAMVRDLFTPEDGARVFSMLMVVQGLAPILAPLIGGYVLAWFGWPTIFWVLAALGAASLAACVFRLPETRVANPSRSLALGEVLRVYARLLVHRGYAGNVLAGAFSISGMFAYIAGAPFVFIEWFKLPAQHFGWLFAANSLGILAVSQINGLLLPRLGTVRLLRIGALIQACGAGALVAAAATGFGGIAGIIAPLFVYVACIGVVYPNSVALAMGPHPENAGAASALLGTLQYTLATVCALAVGGLHAVQPLPMALIMVACGAGGVLVHRVLVPRSGH
jgi:DHA1 family bicyclomycin/chloramphenicol resistance-like MFS transporter